MVTLTGANDIYIVVFFVVLQLFLLALALWRNGGLLAIFAGLIGIFQVVEFITSGPLITYTISIQPFYNATSGLCLANCTGIITMGIYLSGFLWAPFVLLPIIAFVVAISIAFGGNGGN